MTIPPAKISTDAQTGIAYFYSVLEAHLSCFLTCSHNCLDQADQIRYTLQKMPSALNRRIDTDNMLDQKAGLLIVHYLIL
jgi:hypothetical protein